MKSSLTSIALVMALSAVCVLCQKTELTTADVPNINFSAIVVSDADASANWYLQVLSATLKESSQDSQGNKIRILESPGVILELLELTGSVDPSIALVGLPAGTPLKGLFKIGFEVPDFDSFVQHLSGLGISIPQVWGTASAKNRNFIVLDPDGNRVQFFE